jgi:hypothetical protein
MTNADLKELGAAFRPWKQLTQRQEEHEEASAAVEIQRVVRSFVERRRHATTDRGMQMHYIRLKVNEFSLQYKQKQVSGVWGGGRRMKWWPVV